MTYEELLPKVKDLSTLQYSFQYGDGDAYMDFDEYVVPHCLAEEDDTYSGWMLTLAFSEGELVSSEEKILLNTPENGWDEDAEVPEEHLPEVKASLNALKQKLVELGVPAEFLKEDK